MEKGRLRSVRRIRILYFWRNAIMQIPNLRSSNEKVGEIGFFGRMLDKIRLYHQGKLPDDYNRGFGLDGQCLRFLQVEYDALVKRVLSSGTDEEILEWCFENGRRHNNEEIQIWNQFMEKRVWLDD
ncbi:MAG: DUF5069 domain-containing protein, partial [Gemmatimonadetes bacterium]|nr:DUF5069 domain-containing protein [Gemmatimonadota bacterium]